MNYVKQAYALESNKKESAKRIYGDAVREMVNKNYERLIDDAHVELSAIFGQMWVSERMLKHQETFSSTLLAESNVAFNYANFTLGISGRFIAYAKELVSKNDRIDDKKLKAITKQMNCMLTKTTAERTSLAAEHYCGGVN